ncbi:hypothetical protein [Brucella anthropi]|nr:hypothetical protein [Brucella anthropi]
MTPANLSKSLRTASSTALTGMSIAVPAAILLTIAVQRSPFF